MERGAGSSRDLDRVFADFICRLAGRGQAQLRPLALALSRATGEGHSCLLLDGARCRR
jgi:hypothetical protein